MESLLFISSRQHNRTYVYYGRAAVVMTVYHMLVRRTRPGSPYRWTVRRLNRWPRRPGVAVPSLDVYAASRAWAMYVTRPPPRVPAPRQFGPGRQPAARPAPQKKKCGGCG